MIGGTMAHDNLTFNMIGATMAHDDLTFNVIGATMAHADLTFNMIGATIEVAHQAPPSMGFSRQNYWSGLPFSSPGDLPNPGIEPRPPALWADALPSEPPGKPLSFGKSKIILKLKKRFKKQNRSEYLMKVF